MKAIDLHVHSNYSDGTCTIDELLQLAIEKGLAAIALTDHDCVKGVAPLREKAALLRNSATTNLRSDDPAMSEYIWDTQSKPNERLSIPEIIPGAEFSTDYNGHEIHMVGLYLDTENEILLKYLEDFLQSRENRNIRLCKALQEGEGFDITYDKLKARYPGAAITRAHYARYLYDMGFTKSLKEAFDRYIGDHCKYFLPREKVSPSTAIEIIHEAGGLAILAHPILYGFGSSSLDNMVKELCEDGLDGIEAVYSTYCPADERRIRALAAKYDLLLSGGSDFHGSNKKDIDLGTGMGHLFVPEEFLDKMKEYRDNSNKPTEAK